MKLFFLIATILVAVISGYICYPLSVGDIMDIEISADSEAYYMTLFRFGNEHKIQVFRTHLFLDFVFLVVYAGLFYTVTKWLVQKNDLSSWMPLIYLTPIAAFLDVIENIFLYYHIDHIGSSLAFTTCYYVTVVKFGLIGINALLIFYLWIRATFHTK
jgi:hypothetical protein